MKTVYKVLAISLLWAILLSSFRVRGDTGVRLQMAHAWLTGGDEITIPPDYQPELRVQGTQRTGVLGRDGKRYSIYDIGQSLLMLPGDWLGTQLHKAIPQQNEVYVRQIIARWVTFVPLNAVLIVACFWLLKTLDFAENVAALGSICLLLGTTLMQYVQSSHQNNQILLFVVLAYGCATVAFKTKSEKKSQIFSFLSGLAGGAAFSIRQTSIVHLFTIFLFTVGCEFSKQKNIVKTFKTSLVWALGVLPMVLTSRIFDYVRIGVFWQTAAKYAVRQKRLGLDPLFVGLPDLPANFPFSNPPWVGIWGVLFSPAKSIFIYDPLLLPCLLLGIILWRKLSPIIKIYLAVNLLNLLLHIALYSKLDFWHGDAAWGARYHVTSVHLLLIPLVGLLVQNLLNARGLYLWSIRILLIIAIAVQIPSVILRPSAETGRIYFAKPESFLEFRLAERVTNVGCLINNGFAADCDTRLALDDDNPLFTKTALWPLSFTGKRTLAFMVWGVIFVIAIAATCQFYLFCARSAIERNSYKT